MTLLPQSLFARLFTALVGVILVSLVIVALLIARERRELAFLNTGAWSTTRAIADTSESLASLKGTERERAIANLRQHPIVLEDLRRRRPPPRPEELQALEQSFAAQLRRQLGTGYVVSVQRASPGNTDVIHVEGARRIQRFQGRPGSPAAPPPEAGLDAQPESPPDVSGPESARRDPNSSRPGGASPARGLDSATASEPAPFGEPVPGAPPRVMAERRGPFIASLYDVAVTLPDGERVMFRAMAPFPAPPLPRLIFIELGVLTGALGIALFLMVLTITRPLRDLATAADAVGRGAYGPPLPEQGARELRLATRAFNTMQERLRRYLESRTRVLAAMSHDLRTTLTRLRLRAESIDSEELRTRFAADLDEMAQMVQGALSLFRDLNDDEPLDTVDLDALLATLQREFTEMDAEVTIEGHTRGPLSAKPLALKRCLTNLLQNAVQYGTRARVIVSDGDEVVIRIRDAGPGIPEEALEQVFEPFFRLEASRNRDTGGAGLGLSIARDIAQAHGGSIVLGNSPGGGLEVVLTLPRSQFTQHPRAAPAHGTPRSHATSDNANAEV